MRSTKTCDLRVKTVLSRAPKVQSQILLAESFHLLINAVHSQNVDRILKQKNKSEPHTRPEPIEPIKSYEKSTKFFFAIFSGKL